jgi:hypothetical protein
VIVAVAVDLGSRVSVGGSDVGGTRVGVDVSVGKVGVYEGIAGSFNIILQPEIINATNKKKVCIKLRTNVI